MDRDKVINYAEETLSNVLPDEKDTSGIMVKVGWIRDVLALLKKQEPKNVIESTNMYTGLPITHCQRCGVTLDRFLYGRQHEGQINYCPMCGQAIKWE